MDWHEVDFYVPLSGSYLFDIHALALAKELCDKYPGLEMDFNYSKDDKIHLIGKLNDYWYNEFEEEVFNRRIEV